MAYTTINYTAHLILRMRADMDPWYDGDGRFDNHPCAGAWAIIGGAAVGAIILAVAFFKLAGY